MDEVFAYLTDVERVPEWQTNVLFLRLESAGGYEPVHGSSSCASSSDATNRPDRGAAVAAPLSRREVSRRARCRSSSA